MVGMGAAVVVGAVVVEVTVNHLGKTALTVHRDLNVVLDWSETKC